MKKYNVNWFWENEITLISEWFLDLEKAKKYFDTVKIWDYFTMKTISFESNELYLLKSLSLDEVDNIWEDWKKRKNKTLFYK